MFDCYWCINRLKCDKCSKCSKWKYCLGDSFHTFNFDENRPNFCINDIYWIGGIIYDNKYAKYVKKC